MLAGAGWRDSHAHSGRSPGVSQPAGCEPLNMQQVPREQRLGERARLPQSSDQCADAGDRAAHANPHATSRTPTGRRHSNLPPPSLLRLPVSPCCSCRGRRRWDPGGGGHGQTQGAAGGGASCSPRRAPATEQPRHNPHPQFIGAQSLHTAGAASRAGRGQHTAGKPERGWTSGPPVQGAGRQKPPAHTRVQVPPPPPPRVCAGRERAAGHMQALLGLSVALGADPEADTAQEAAGTEDWEEGEGQGAWRAANRLPRRSAQDLRPHQVRGARGQHAHQDPRLARDQRRGGDGAEV